MISFWRYGNQGSEKLLRVMRSWLENTAVLVVRFWGLPCAPGRGVGVALQTSSLPILVSASEPLTSRPRGSSPARSLPCHRRRQQGQGPPWSEQASKQAAWGLMGLQACTPLRAALLQKGSIGMTTLRPGSPLPGVGEGRGLPQQRLSAWKAKQHAMWLNHPHFLWEILLSNPAMQCIS